MGGSSGGGGKYNPPSSPRTAPPPVEAPQAEYITPTITQEAARRAKQGGTYATKGQKLGASGEVLGASPTELANVTEYTGVDMTEKKVARPRMGGLGAYLMGFRGREFTGRALNQLKSRGYQDSTKYYTVKRKRSIFGGHRTKTKSYQRITYDDYLRQYNERVAKQKEEKRKGLTI